MARKPIVQYVAEELVKNKVENMLFVTGRSEASIENHFDSDPELIRMLTDGKKDDLLDELKFEEMAAQIFYTRQRVQRGQGDAILFGESFASAPSRRAVAGPFAFSPIIFDMIRRVRPDKGGEIQITDAIQLLCEEGKRVLALKLPKQDRRCGIGNFLSYFETFVEFVLADPLYGPG